MEDPRCARRLRPVGAGRATANRQDWMMTMHTIPTIVPDGVRCEIGAAGQNGPLMREARLRRPGLAPRNFRQRQAMVITDDDDFAALALSSIVVGFLALCIVGLCLWIYCAPVDSFDWVPKMVVRA